MSGDHETSLSRRQSVAGDAALRAPEVGAAARLTAPCAQGLAGFAGRAPR